MEKLKYTTLLATKFESHKVSVSVDPTNPEWFKSTEGHEFLVKVDLVIQGSVLKNYKDLNERDRRFNLIDDTQSLLDLNALTDLCEITGTLVLADEMNEEGYDPYEVCDSYFDELEYMYSVLKTYNFDFSEEAGRKRTVFYIDHINWKNHVDFKTRFYVMNQIKGFLIELYHTRVDIICIDTAPLEVEDDFILTEEGREFMVKVLKTMLEKQGNEEGNFSKIIDFNQFMPMKEKSGTALSAEDKETIFIEINENELINEFANYGFKKVGNTSLLAKFV